MPLGLQVLVGRFADLPFHRERRTSPAAIRAALGVPLAADRPVFVAFPNTAQYSVVGYLPQAAGIALLRPFGAPPLLLAYGARFANLLVGTALLAFAIRQSPALRWLLAMMALLPMATFLRGSASADVTATAAAFLLVATAAKLAWGPREELRGWDVPLLAAATGVLCLAKVPYAPLGLLLLLVPRERLPWRRRAPAYLLQAAVIVAGSGIAMVTALAVGPLRSDAVVSPRLQLSAVLAHPFRFLGIAIADYFQHAQRYLLQFMGALGWLDVHLPKGFLLAYLVALMALLFLDADPRLSLASWQRVVLAGATFAAMLLISASQYATWTPYGATYLDGIQGRYFLPLAPAGAWACHCRAFGGRVAPRRLALGLALVWAASTAITLVSLIGRYYG
jgi:uncharacterized membrane protein